MRRRKIPLSVLIILLFSSGASAYYQIPDDSPPEVRLKTDAENNTESNRLRPLVLYLNEDLPAAADRAYVMPQPDHFVPADIILVNQPLYLSMRKPIRTDGNLSSVLYANLKLKRLIEMYEDLQKRASEILSGLSVPVVEPEPLGLIHKTDSVSSIEQEGEGLATSLRAISHRFSFQSAASSSVSSDAVATYRVKTLPTLVKRLETDGDPLVVIRKSDLPTNGNEYDAAAGSPEGQREAPISTHEVKNTSLPWVFEVGLKFVKYLFSHKLEAVFLGAFFMVSAMLLSSIRRR